MTANEFENGKIYFSVTTQIYYKRVKNILYKLPTYGKIGNWEESKYKGDQTYFKLATKQQLEFIKGIK